MKMIDILEGFEIEINKIDDAVGKPNVVDSEYWLNQAVIKFVKLRFNGDFVHKTSYEQNEKRRNDLLNLYKEQNVILSGPYVINNLYDEYKVIYDDDVLFTLNEDVTIQDKEGGRNKETSVFECTADSFMYRITNSLTDFHYRFGNARPLRVRTIDGCLLFTDKNYNITRYKLGYLRFPKKITLSEPFDEYLDFDDVTMPEIIKMAAQMYLENIKEERYKTITQEVNTQE